MVESAAPAAPAPPAAAPAVRPAAAPPASPAHPAPAPAAAARTESIAYAGIGDEAAPGLAAQIAAVDTLGWRHLELRTVDGTAVADLDPTAFARLADELTARGVVVCCVDSRIGNWARPVTADFAPDLRELAILADRCAVLGTDRIRVMSYPNDGLSEREWRRRALDRVRRLCDLAEPRGLRLLVENCAGWAADSAERVLDLLDSADSPALGLLFDTGNGVAHGYHAPDLLADIAARVAHVHVKDARPGPDGAVYTVPGEGEAGVADCLRLLLAAGYQGVWSIEPHLALRPHEPGTALSGDPAAFTAAGEALRRLVDRVVAPAAPGWSSGALGLVRRVAR
ncbi:sugar phosphate isomerase/epimerase [Streptomonospora sp. S1-112]|uniref:Sugar phosphate isomerase/epimerase n=1 Tax=Streptomonospora mangrovi TaxID=2883123 RepID=A0A9X3NT27_9ACTN|nr:sugar phosphate isomerase/epimerase family protein [Streptomonospora mangrovi]MDA0567828.1 sugar phosphate isomerase/epimerase [Streptomonospora mangrovi]